MGKGTPAVAMLLPVDEIRKIVADLDGVALQLGPNASKFYQHLSEGLAEFDAHGDSVVSDYEV